MLCGFRAVHGCRTTFKFRKWDNMNNRYLCDWITFTSKIHSPEDITKILGLDMSKFESCDFGLKGLMYRKMIRYANICILYDGVNNSGVCCSMSGTGCRAFEKYGNGDWKRLFNIIMANYDLDPDKRKMNVTRFDLAYDMFNHDIDLSYLQRYILDGNYVSDFSKKNITCCSHADNTELSVTIGSRSSDSMIRFYDKLDEQKIDKKQNTTIIDNNVISLDELDYWVRCEIQLRNEQAFACMKFIFNELMPIDELFHGIINNKFRCVEPTQEDSNKRRWNWAKFWTDFLVTFNKVHLLEKVPGAYSIENLNRFVIESSGSAIATYVDIHGLSFFLAMLANHRKEKGIKAKYDNLIKECGLASDNLSYYADMEKEFNEAVENYNDNNDIFQPVMWGLS